jgi:hypothetical protein
MQYFVQTRGDYNFPWKTIEVFNTAREAIRYVVTWAGPALELATGQQYRAIEVDDEGATTVLTGGDPDDDGDGMDETDREWQRQQIGED